MTRAVAVFQYFFNHHFSTHCILFFNLSVFFSFFNSETSVIEDVSAVKSTLLCYPVSTLYLANCKYCRD